MVAQIADTLREGVILGHLKPGERIRQDDFATQLGVSRTPLREAFRVLENEGWLISRPRVGAEVAGLTAVEAEEIALMRLLLEPFAGRIATVAHEASEEAVVDRLLHEASQPMKGLSDMGAIDDANRALHFTIYGIASETIPAALAATLEHHWQRFSRYRRLYWTEPSDQMRSIPDHEHIVDSWKRRDAGAVEREVARHVLTAVIALIQRLEPGAAISPALLQVSDRFQLVISDE